MFPIDQRASPRRRVKKRVRLRWSVADVPATIQNESKGGAMLVVDGAPPRGTIATILSGMEELTVMLMWADGRRAGVRFLTE